MKVGDIFVIVNEFPYYNERNIPKFVEIEVIEEKFNVPGEFSGKLQGSGFIAKGSDGYIYARNYPRYYEGYSTAAWCRYLPDNKFLALSEAEKNKFIEHYLWMDVTTYQCPEIPKFAKWFRREIIFCEKHQHLYYDGEECFYCKNDIPPKQGIQMNMIEHKWLGWYD